VRLSAIKIAAKPITATVTNITVVTGMCVRKSIISQQRYGRADAEKKDIAIVSTFQRDCETLAICPISRSEQLRLETGCRIGVTLQGRQNLQSYPLIATLSAKPPQPPQHRSYKVPFIE
jgi:hypothetical protein